MRPGKMLAYSCGTYQPVLDTLGMLMLPGIRWLGLGDGERMVMAVWRTRWKRARWWLLALLAAAGALVLVIGGYRFGWDWMGLDTSPKSNTTNPAKSVWDWLQLLIIPAALAGIALWFNWQQGKTARALSLKQSEIEREIAQDQQREAALQSYFDRMAELLLKEQLRDSKKGDVIRYVALARTQTVLRRLDKDRKAALLKFLYSAKLIEKDQPIIRLSDGDLVGVCLNRAHLSGVDLYAANLTGADMSEADLYGANLNAANLSGANLSGANLTEADLSGAGLSGANLSGAKISEGQLRVTKSLKGAIRPDGSVYRAVPFLSLDVRTDFFPPSS